MLGDGTRDIDSATDEVDPTNAETVTVVRQDPEAIGRLAAERLFALIDGDASVAATHTIPVELLARGSGEV